MGNWSSYIQNATTENRTYGDAHELTAVDSTSLSYDVNGNLTEDQLGQLYSWDADDQLTAVDTDGDSTDDVTYAYDALGRRVSRTDSSQTTYYAMRGWQTLAEYSASAPTTAAETFVYGSYIDEPIQKIGTGGTVYLHHNRQFSVSALTDTSGNVQERYAYGSHGTPLMFTAAGATRSSSSYGNNRLFTGADFDPQVGLLYLRNRYYSASNGFVSRDPAGYVDGASLYLGYFAEGGLDPWGLKLTRQQFESFFDYLQDFNGGQLNPLVQLGVLLTSIDQELSSLESTQNGLRFCLTLQDSSTCSDSMAGLPPTCARSRESILADIALLEAHETNLRSAHEWALEKIAENGGVHGPLTEGELVRIADNAVVDWISSRMWVRHRGPENHGIQGTGDHFIVGFVWAGLLRGGVRVGIAALADEVAAETVAGTTGLPICPSGFDNTARRLAGKGGGLASSAPTRMSLAERQAMVAARTPERSCCTTSKSERSSSCSRWHPFIDSITTLTKQVKPVFVHLTSCSRH